MKFFFGLISGVVITILVAKFIPSFVASMQKTSLISPLGVSKQKPFDEFSISSLRARNYVPTPIVLDEIIEENELYSVRTFRFSSEGRKITGLAHIPGAVTTDTPGQNKFPVILQLRGYVDPSQYYPGLGTKHSSEVYAKKGYVTLAPDFIGYGGSDPLTDNIFFDRFETYTTVINLLTSVQTLPMADASKVGIWGHSNGGHIALVVNEILKKPVPTVLWAPVSVPFPYSILYYTDESADHGRFLRKELAKFESDYEVEQFSLTNYLDWIVSPLQIHQGTEDEAVPQKWNDALVERLRTYKKDVTYFVYQGADHDMRGSWDIVMDRDIQFFSKYLK